MAQPAAAGNETLAEAAEDEAKRPGSALHGTNTLGDRQYGQADAEPSKSVAEQQAHERPGPAPAPTTATDTEASPTDHETIQKVAVVKDSMGSLEDSQKVETALRPSSGVTVAAQSAVEGPTTSTGSRNGDAADDTCVGTTAAAADAGSAAGVCPAAAAEDAAADGAGAAAGADCAEDAAAPNHADEAAPAECAEASNSQAETAASSSTDQQEAAAAAEAGAGSSSPQDVHTDMHDPATTTAATVTLQQSEVDAAAAEAAQVPTAVQEQALDETAPESVPPDMAGESAASEAEADTGAGPESSEGQLQEAAHDSSTSSSTRQPNKSYFVDGVRALDVEVDCGQGLPCKLLHVTLDVSALQPSTKPFLGGFRHKQTGTTFHHASIQTPQDQSPNRKAASRQPGAAVAAAAAAGSEGCLEEQQDVSWVGVKLTRETQTIKATSCSSQTVREAATQMAVPGLLLDCSGDRALTPRPYVSAEVVGQRREAAALTIQRFSRGWFARKRAAVLRGIKAERDAFLEETAAESAQAAFDHKRREVERRTHPLSKADFALLASELEAWRQQQTGAIKNAGLDPKEEQAALQLLLAKETRLLHTLDRLRVAAHQERRVVGRQQQLGGLAQPKTWALSNGKKVLVHTPLTVRAAELQQLYRGLTLDSLSLDERLDVLLHVKWVAREYDCSTTRELVELIDREADLLNRGRSPKTLDGLRKRIAGLFLTCCQNPAFNPEAARLRVNAVGLNGPEAFEYVLE